MRKQGKRQRGALILALLIILNITVRAPLTSHLVYHDSYVSLWKTGKIIELSDAIDDNAGPWRIDLERIISLASTLARASYRITDFKKLYPLPPPIIQPLNVAAYSLVTGVKPEHSAQAYSILFGVIACIGAYLLASQLSKDRIVCYLTGFLYSTAPVFLQITSSTHMSRGLIASTLPFLFLSLMRYHKSRETRHLISSLLYSVFLILSHRIGYVSIIILLSYLSASTASKKLGKTKIPLKTPLLYLLTLAILALYPLQSKKGIFQQALWDYRQGVFTQGWTIKPILTNMLVDYYTSLGFLTILAAAGLIMLAQKLAKPRFKDIYLASYLLFLAPFTVFGEYVGILMMPVSAYLASEGVRALIKQLMKLKAVNYSQYVMPYLAIFTILSSLIFSLFMTGYWMNSTRIPFLPLNQETSDRLISTVAYVNDVSGKVASPEYITLLGPYMAYYLTDESKVFFIPDLANKALSDAPYIILSESIRKTWTPPFLGLQNFTVSDACKSGDIVYSDGVFAISKKNPTSMHSAVIDFTGAFRGFEKIIGLCDGGLYIVSPQGRKLLPVSRYLTHGIEDLKHTGERNATIKTSDGKTHILNPSGLHASP